MEKKFPQIKKELKRFVQDERGTVSKKAILKAGVALSTITFLATEVSAHHVQSHSHSNALSLSYDGSEATGRHTHAINHKQSC